MNKLLLLTLILLPMSCTTSKIDNLRAPASSIETVLPEDLGQNISSEEAEEKAESVKNDIYPYRTTLKTEHKMRILNDGTAALYKRLEMIRNAKHTLELEYFIFNPDTVGRIVIKELVKAAERGVKVRILVDKSMAVFKLDEYYAEVLKEKNIEIRYYNAAPFYQVSTVQFRNHRKLFVRDREEAITGGRNIADEYFNLSKEFNFLDRDIWVEGDVVQAMSDSFELFWKSDIVETPKSVVPKLIKSANPHMKQRDKDLYAVRMSKYKKARKYAEELVAANKEDDEALNFVMEIGEKSMNTHAVNSCSHVAFATDREGAGFVQRIHSRRYHSKYRQLRKEIAKWIYGVEKELYIDSPYFLNNSRIRQTLDYLMENNKKVTILTNSLSSTDAVYVSAVFNPAIKEYTSEKLFKAYSYKGTFSDDTTVMNDEYKNAQWGTHSKSMVFNEDSFMVGTFNIDNRSNFYNTEMALFCGGSKELTNDVLGNIKKRMSNSFLLDKKGKPADGSDVLDGNSTKKKILYRFLQVPSFLFQFLL